MTVETESEAERDTARHDGVTNAPDEATTDVSSKLFGRGLLYVVVFSLQLVVGSLISPFLTHLIGPAQFGALSSGIAVYQVLTVAALLGLDEVLVLQRADERERGRLDDRSARGLVTVAVVLSFLVTALALLTLPLWAGPLGFTGLHVLLVAVILWTAPSAAVTVMLGLLVAQDRLRAFTVVSIISAVGGSIVGIALLVFVDRDATTYAWGGVVCQFVAMSIGFAVVRPNLDGFKRWAVTSRAIRLGVPLALGGLAFFVLNAGDRIIIQRDLGAVEVGRYQVAYVIGSAVIILLNFTNSAWTPHFAALTSNVARYLLAMKSRDELYRLLVPIVLAVTLVSPLALRILAPASFSPHGLTLVVLLVALTAFPVTASGAAQRLLIVERRGKTVGVVAGIAAVVNIVINLLLVTPLGIAGAAIATLVSYSLLAVLEVRLLPDRLMWKGAPPRLLLAIGLSVAVAAASMLLPETTTWNIVKAAAAFACLPWFWVRLRAARSGAAEPVGDEPVGDEPAADAGPGPRRVVSVDLDAPLPDLTRDPRYSTAMVVGYRSSVPVGAADIRLTDDPHDAARALAHLAALPASAAPAEVVPDNRLPSISVVVSTIVRRPDDLAVLLDAFDALEYPDVEFLLVDNRTALPDDDCLPAIVAGRDRIRVVRESRAGVSSGRNAGVEQARGEIVAFTDDDVRVDDRWLRVIGSRFARADGIDALTWLILPAELETPAQIWFEGYYGGFAGERLFAPLLLEAAGDLPRAIRGSKISVQDPAGHETARLPIYGIGAYGAGANMAFRRSALLRVGGFDRALGTGTPALGGEDLAIIVSILWTGGRLAFEPTAVVHHRHRRSLEELETQLRGYGLGFTAMLTSLVLDDPRHLLSLGWQAPSAAGRLAGRAFARLRRRGTDDAAQATSAAADDLSGGFPKSLVSTELRGFPRGPAAYLRSRRWRRALDRSHIDSPSETARADARGERS